MATTYGSQTVGEGRVVTVTAGKNESSDPVELSAINSVAVTRPTGTVQEGSIQVSNDGETWFQAHSDQWATTTGDGGNVELTALVAAAHLHNILEHARFARLVVTNTALGDTDVVRAVFRCR